MLSSSDNKYPRQRAVAWAMALTANTSLAPGRYERHLLEQYQQGTLTLDHMLHLLNTSVYQLLYRSQAVTPMQEPQLQQLLDQSRRYNEQHQITGMLLYSAGRFIQLLEGPPEEVRALYKRIQQDARHRQVVAIGEGHEPVRRFGQWTMAFRQVAASDIELVLQVEVLQVEQAPSPVPDVNEWHIQALLQACGLGHTGAPIQLRNYLPPAD